MVIFNKPMQIVVICDKHYYNCMDVINIESNQNCTSSASSISLGSYKNDVIIEVSMIRCLKDYFKVVLAFLREN